MTVTGQMNTAHQGSLPGGHNRERSNLMRRQLKHLACFLALLFILAAGPALAKVVYQCPSQQGVPGSYNGDLGAWVSNDGTIACIHLVATDGFANMADKNGTTPSGRLLYTFGFTNVTGVPGHDTDAILAYAELGAEFPAPTINVKQGQQLYLTLTNRSFALRPDLFDGHSVHWHGFPNAISAFDGEPMASFGVFPGASFTYYYKINDPGTYMYHCHVEATEHMQMGMLGNLYVRPAQDGTAIEYLGKTYTTFAYNDGDGSTGYNTAYPLQITSFDPIFHDADQNVQPLPFAAMTDVYPMFNGRGYPDTVNPGVLRNSYNNWPAQKMNSIIRVVRGQRTLLRMSSLATVDFYSITSPHIPFLVVGKDTRLLRNFGVSFYYNTHTVTLGGGQAIDAILDIPSDMPPGRYYIYTSNLSHLANDKEDFGGMMTEIVVQ